MAEAGSGAVEGVLVKGLHWIDLAARVREILHTADDHAYVLAPFIHEEALAAIVPEGKAVTIVTSWRADHVWSGASSLEVYRYCEGHGAAALYIHPSIHLKLFGVDLTKPEGRALMGSANVTRSGLGMGREGNRELIAGPVRLGWKDRVEVQRVIVEARLVDVALYDCMKEWLQSQEDRGEDLEPPVVEGPGAGGSLLVTELPLIDSPTRLWEIVTDRGGVLEWWEADAAVHDLALYGGLAWGSLEEFLSETRRGFVSQRFIKRFLAEIDEDGLFFGRIKEWVQETCEDVPAPRRRELTKTVQALMRWTVELLPEGFEIVRPSYSECLRRRKGL